MDGLATKTLPMGPKKNGFIKITLNDIISDNESPETDNIMSLKVAVAWIRSIMSNINRFNNSRQTYI